MSNPDDVLTAEQIGLVSAAANLAIDAGELENESAGQPKWPLKSLAYIVEDDDLCCAVANYTNGTSIGDDEVRWLWMLAHCAIRRIHDLLPEIEEDADDL